VYMVVTDVAPERIQKVSRSNTCDRCGKTASVSESGTGSGWVFVNRTHTTTPLDFKSLIESIKDTERKELCSTCADEHETWLNTKVG